MSTAGNIALHRTFALACSLPLLLAAAPASNEFLQQPMMAEVTIDAGSARAPMATTGDGFAPAPIPDFNRDAPLGRQADSNAARLSPKLFHKQTVYHGEGYVFGSTVQDEQDRRIGPSPGVNLIMPLQ